jgi:hypothetical protein
LPCFIWLMSYNVVLTDTKAAPQELESPRRPAHKKLGGTLWTTPV